jgi:phosphoribosylanthranilate isomerase
MVKIKICGITNREDYNLALANGADYTGFIFYEGSPRYVDPHRVKQIICSGRGGSHLKVGVFVNEEPHKVADIFHLTGLDLVQLHGDESPEYCSELGLPFWKVIRVRDQLSSEPFHEIPADTFLLDTYSETIKGGTGRSFDLQLAGEAMKTGKNIIIAGGVSISNIVEILSLSPYGVDVNSSLERIPGKKCAVKMRRFFDKIRSRG